MSAEKVRVEAPAMHVYRRGRRVVTAATMTLAYLVSCFSGLASGAAWSAAWMTIAPILMLFTYAVAFQKRWHRGAIECDGRTVTISDRGQTDTYDLEDLSGGTLITEDAASLRSRVDAQDDDLPKSGDVAGVRFEMNHGSWVEAWTSSLEDAERLLARAGVDSRGHRFTLHSRATWRRIFAALGGVVVGALPGGAIAMMLVRSAPGLVIPSALLTIGLVALAFVAASSPPRITVGRDGIAISRPFSSTFYPFDKIDDIIDLRDGCRIRLVVGPEVELHDAWLAVDPARRRALTQRMRAAKFAADERVQSIAPSLLDRQGASVREWRVRLESLAKSADSYRSIRLGTDDLARVLEDPTATPERRIGAALALRAADDSTSIDKIRIAARTTAEERVRVVLENIAQGTVDDDDVQSVLRSRTRAEVRGTPDGTGSPPGAVS